MLATTARDGVALRRALTLQAGRYRIEVAGDRERPADYTLSLRPAAPGLGAPQGEPDDQPYLARPLAPGQALQGVLGPDDPAYVAFTIPEAGHVWELRGVQGLANLALVDGNDRDVGAWTASDGALVLRLALPTGPTSPT